jgi:hypothetical protein
MGDLRPGFEGDDPVKEVMPEIQDGIAGLKNCGVERFGHEIFSLTKPAGSQAQALATCSL